MRRLQVMLCLVTALVMWPVGASALVDLSLSIGEGVVWVDGDAHRLPVSLELIPAYSFLFLRADLGMYLTVEDPADFILRPGMRLMLPWFYARGAFQLKVTHGVDYGFLLGLGKEFLNLGIISLFVEANTHLLHKPGWDVVPLEFRVGASVGF